MTYRASRCLACGHADLQFRPAIVAPFVAARVFQSGSSVCRLAGCTRCGFVFFEDRFDEAEKMPICRISRQRVRENASSLGALVLGKIQFRMRRRTGDG